MGELQHGIYDDHDDRDDEFTYEEINALHGFSENGDVIDEEEYASDQTDNDLNDLSEDSNSDGSTASGFNYVESGDHDDLSSESCDSDMKVRFSYPELIF
jgi:hypothetical protein